MTTLNDTFIMTGLSPMSSKQIKMRRSVTVIIHNCYGPKHSKLLKSMIKCRQEEKGKEEDNNTDKDKNKVFD
jgi:hypothetical protein